MAPPDEQTPADGPKMTGFDQSRMPKAVSMRDPSMGGRRRRTREGRERRRARENRRRVLIFTVGGMVFLTLIGMTVLNVLERNREAAAAEARSDNGKGETNSAAAAAAAAIEGLDPTETSTPKAAPRKASDYGPPTDLEKARDRYLQRSGEKEAGSEDARDSKDSKGAGGAGESAARPGGGEEVSEAEKERVLRQVIPFYRSSKKRNAPPVPADQLYIPDPSKPKPKIGK